MSAPLPEFTLLHPHDVDAALAAAKAHPEARFVAGGTDLLVNMRHGIGAPDTLISLSRIKALRRISATDDGLFIGAGVTLAELARHPVLRHYEAIRDAACVVAGPSHRNAATLGGNLCLDTRCLYYNQSDWWRHSNGYCLKYRGEICHVAPRGKRCRAAFCGDMAPALMVHGARIELATADGTRHLPLEAFYLEDGAAHLVLAPDEIVTGVYLPPNDADSARSAYTKIRIRQAIDFPLAGVALACDPVAEGLRFRLAFTGTNARPVLVDLPEALDSGANDATRDDYFNGLEKLVQRSVSPQRTTTTQPHYRRLAVAAMARRLAVGLAAGSAAGSAAG